MLEKVNSRLDLWKRQYLSKGGRLVFIKYALQNLPIFMLSCRLMPMMVVYEVENIIQHLLWGTT